MNTIIRNTERSCIKPSQLPDWMISHGLATISTEECAYLFGCDKKEVPNKLVYLIDKRRIVSIARGLYLAIPQESIMMGAPEPTRYINDLMNYYDTEYCLGWLSAAKLYQASHQAAQVFQVATQRTISNRIIGRNRLQFYNRSYVNKITRQRIVLNNSNVLVSSLGATMLMVCADVLISGGIDNVATIIYELAQNNNDYLEDIINNAGLFPTAALRRLGWLLEKIAQNKDVDVLANIIDNKTNPSLLSPYDSHSGEIDKKWQLIINRHVEKDD